MKQSLAIVLVACAACRGTPDRTRGSGPAPWFEERASAAGLDFVHQSGHRNRHNLPEIMGGGVALLDYDNDGLLDVYFVQSGNLQDPSAGSGNRLYRNLGNGRFEDVTRSAGAGVRAYGMGVAAGDFDNDGNIDLFVTGLDGNHLLKNDGRGRFEDVTARAGVGGSGWSTSAAFIDYDGDGFLDLFVVRYLKWSASAEIECYSLTGVPDYCSPRSYDLPASSLLYHNNGDGTFTDVSERTGIARAVGNGLGVVAGDFDGNGAIDVYVANDSTPNHLWLNDGRGRFHESALAGGCAVDQDGRAKSGMGVHAIDADDDGDLDLLVVNLDGESDSFFRNAGPYFVDDTAAAGLRIASRPFTRFGAAFADFDNDGWLDLFEANGRVGLQSQRYSADPYAEPSLLFRGFKGPRFAEAQPRGGAARPLIASSRAAAFGDLDNDGGLDVVVVNRDAAPFLLHNVVANRGHWLMLRVLDEHHRDALGAQVRMTIGDRSIRRDVQTAYSYLASNDPRVHVGMGQERAARNVTVRWIDGSTETFGDLPADRVTTLRRGSGKPQ